MTKTTNNPQLHREPKQNRTTQQEQEAHSYTIHTRTK